MSRENVELLTASLEIVQKTRRAVEQTSPDFVWDMSTTGWPDTQTYHGPEGFNEFMAEWTAAYDVWEQDVEAVFDAGEETVVSITVQRGRLKGSDSWVTMRIGIVWTIREGVFMRGSLYTPAEEALTAAGLPASGA